MPDEKKTIERYDIRERPDPDNAPDRPWAVIDTHQDIEVARYPTEAEAITRREMWRRLGLLAVAAAITPSAALARGEHPNSNAGGPNGDDVNDPGNIHGTSSGRLSEGGVKGGGYGRSESYGGGGDPGAMGAGHNPGGPPGSW